MTDEEKKETYLIVYESPHGDCPQAHAWVVSSLEEVRRLMAENWVEGRLWCLKGIIVAERTFSEFLRHAQLP